MSLSDKNQTYVIESLISTSRYLYDLLNIDNPILKILLVKYIQLKSSK